MSYGQNVIIELENEKPISFISFGDKYWEYNESCFFSDFPELKNFDSIADWADAKCVFYNIEEHEYVFPIPYWENMNQYFEKNHIPQELRPIFEALFKKGKELNKGKNEENQIVPRLVLTLPRV